MQESGSPKRVGFLEVLNAVGSLASITGISLLYLKNGGNWDIEDIVVISLMASCGLGLASLILWAFIEGYRHFAATTPLMVRIAYFALGVPLALLIGLLIALSVNKAFISVDWQWFFHGR